MCCVTVAWCLKDSSGTMGLGVLLYLPEPHVNEPVLWGGSSLCLRADYVPSTVAQELVGQTGHREVREFSR